MELQLYAMKIYLYFLVKVLLITVVFLLLLVAAILITTLVAQGDMHPDDWTTTVYDIAAIVLVLAAYLLVLAKASNRFFKAKNARTGVKS
ncbi:MAG: hypothetical protein V4812_18010 [Pseudomonadota bacterium]